MDSTVAKVHQSGLDPKKIEIVSGPGVDVLAVTILASAVTAATGSGARRRRRLLILFLLIRPSTFLPRDCVTSVVPIWCLVVIL